MNQDILISSLLFPLLFFKGGFGGFSIGGLGAGGFDEDPLHICPKQNAKHITACSCLILGFR